MEFVFPEIQLAKIFQKFGFLVRRHKLRSIVEPFRKRGQRLEKTELTTTHASLDIGGCRLCERMSDISLQELASAIVRDAVHRYIESRRGRIDAFVDRHFTLAGSVALHRRALGWDLLRAPANLFLAGPALAVKLMAWAARRAGMERAAAWLAGRRLLLETEVAREIEWLVATELLEIPCRDEIGSRIVTLSPKRYSPTREQPRSSVAPAGIRRRFSPPACRRGRDLSRVAHRDGRDRNRLCCRRSRCSGRQAGDPGSGDPELGSGGDDRATDGNRCLSARRQSRRVVVQPVSGCRRSRTARRHDRRRIPRRRHAGRLFRGRDGSVAAPAGPASGRLERLLRILEADLCGERGRIRLMRDQYVARLVDLFDLIALAMRVSHA